MVGDNLDNHHVPQKDLAKKNGTDGYPQDGTASTAPAIRINRETHKQTTRDQMKNKTARSKMTPRELLADDARIMRKHKVPNDKIQEIIELNKIKYGFNK